MPIELTYGMCMVAGQDAGNKNMRKNNRLAWNVNDWNVAADLANKLLHPTLKEVS